MIRDDNRGMLLNRRELPVLIVNLVYLSVFLVISLREFNSEFVLYTCVVLGVIALVVWNQRRVQFGLPILWGLTVWGMLHLAGGNIRIGDGVLYGLELIRILPSCHILRYDQVIHMFGFGVATLMCHHLLRPYLKSDTVSWGMLPVLVVLMGCGFGALNEIVEFATVLLVPETGVGGYENTMLDLVFNLLGGILAAMWIVWRSKPT